MPPPEAMPTLADLRRTRTRRSTRDAEPALMQGLFDTLPEEEPEATEAVTTADVIAELNRHEPHHQTTSTVFTVTELIRQVRSLVERSYAQVAVEGEISNWRPSASGHCYFTLKDREAQISVVLFRRQASLLRFQPKDGDAVRLRGQLSVYESRGQMQLIAEWMEPLGLGAMLAAVRELKERLRREGLFDNQRPLPHFPRCIGVVTSLQGAALRDIVKVCRRRHAAVRLLIYPAAVQGPRCAIEVADGVRWFSTHPGHADVVLVARGGGSWEDLHGFDDEALARAIAACSLPVIAGIGHATDSTIADAAADVCAPTPSAAAELLTAAHFRVEERVQRLAARLERAGTYELLRARQKMSKIRSEEALKRVEYKLTMHDQTIEDLQRSLQTHCARHLQTRHQKLALLTNRISRQNVRQRLSTHSASLKSLVMKIKIAPASTFTALHSRIAHAEVRLNSLNPLRVLERGYAIVYGPDTSILRSASQVTPGERVTTRLASGSISSTVFARKLEAEKNQ
jgi:exodeoxyribonuclease VII large subunit